MRRRLDIYFIENKLIAKALDEFYALMAKTLDTDDFISKKVDTSIKEMVESKFKSDLKAIKKETKRYLKKRNKAIKRGEIDYDAEFNTFLERIGVDFEEYLPAVVEATEVQEMVSENSLEELEQVINDVTYEEVTSEDVVNEAYEAFTENPTT